MTPTGDPKKRLSPLRAKILDAALHLYTSKGYFNTSIHHIQGAAAVSMGSIYNYFAGKEAIAQALYDDLLGEMETMVDDVARTAEGAHDQARAVVAAMFALTESDPEKVGYILNARHREFLVDEPDICSSQPFVKMRDIIIRGMQRGEVREMDSWVAASLAYGPALRMISLRLDGVVLKPLPGALDDLWEATWQALRPAEAQTTPS